jgi:hypothetical protein
MSDGQVLAVMAMQAVFLLAYLAITAWGAKLKRDYQRLLEQPMVCERCGETEPCVACGNTYCDGRCEGEP